MVFQSDRFRGNFFGGASNLPYESHRSVNLISFSNNSSSVTDANFGAKIFKNLETRDLTEENLNENQIKIYKMEQSKILQAVDSTYSKFAKFKQFDMNFYKMNEKFIAFQKILLLGNHSGIFFGF